MLYIELEHPYRYPIAFTHPDKWESKATAIIRDPSNLLATLSFLSYKKAN